MLFRSVGSVVVRIDRHTRPLVDVDEALLFRVIDASFAERRKTIRNGVRRLGFGAEEADRILVDADVAPGARPEELGVRAFARIAAALPA